MLPALLHQLSRCRLHNFSIVALRQFSSAPHTTTLPWSLNRYNSVRVDLSTAVCNGWKLKYMDDFPSLLSTYLDNWRKDGHSAVWLTLPVSLSALIPLAVDKGFSIHHAKGTDVVLTCWLLKNKPNKLPPYATHQVGVCGVVYRDDTKEVLVTQDKHKAPVWKFPGGVADPGEDIAVTAVREVREETGIEAEFQSILAFRQQHRLINYFDISDLYFLCRLTPLNYDLSLCPDELVACEWVELEQLLSNSQATPLTQRVARLLKVGLESGYQSVDIIMEEWIMPYSGWTRDKTYKLFVNSHK